MPTESVESFNVFTARLLKEFEDEVLSLPGTTNMRGLSLSCEAWERIRSSYKTPKEIFLHLNKLVLSLSQKVSDCLMKETYLGLNDCGADFQFLLENSGSFQQLLYNLEMLESFAMEAKVNILKSRCQEAHASLLKCCSLKNATCSILKKGGIQLDQATNLCVRTINYIQSNAEILPNLVHEIEMYGDRNDVQNIEGNLKPKFDKLLSSMRDTFTEYLISRQNSSTP